MLRQIPNILTALRFPLTAVFLYGFLQPEGEIVWQIIGILSFMLSALTDLLDGIIARKMNSVTKIGAFLDPLADKVQVLSGFAALLLKPDIGWGQWKILIIISVCVIALREIVITWWRSYKFAKSKPPRTSFLAKAKTMTQMITLIVAIVLLGIVELLHVNETLYLAILVLIGGGIVASAVLAAMSAYTYLKD